MKIILPLPPQCLRPNLHRGHWAKRSSATKKCRAEATLVTKLANQWDWDRPNMQATFYFRDKRARDDDNLIGWLKAYRDGIADGLGINDRDIFTLRPIQLVDRANPRVEIELKESV